MFDFNQFKLLTFDCYGTLIDWEQGIVNCLCPLLTRHDVAMSDDGLLELYAHLESTIQQQGYQPYRDVLRKVMLQLSMELQFRLEENEHEFLAESIRDWPPFDDTVEALSKLKQRFKLGIISNIDNDLFESSRHQLKTVFDYVITAQQVQAYKPSHDVFEYAFGQFELPREKILHVAQSQYHDIAPANRLGLKSVWVNRRKGKSGGGATPIAVAQPDLEVGNLAELVELLK